MCDEKIFLVYYFNEKIFSIKIKILSCSEFKKIFKMRTENLFEIHTRGNEKQKLISPFQEQKHGIFSQFSFQFSLSLDSHTLYSRKLHGEEIITIRKMFWFR